VNVFIAGLAGGRQKNEKKIVFEKSSCLIFIRKHSITICQGVWEGKVIFCQSLIH